MRAALSAFGRCVAWVIRKSASLLLPNDPMGSARTRSIALPLDLGGAHSDQLELVLGCTADEAFWLFSGREPRTPARQDARRAASRR